MLRQSIHGFRRPLLPMMALGFLFLLALSAGEAVWGTPRGTFLFYLILWFAFLAVALSLLFCVFYSCEYSLVQDVLVVRKLFRRQERQVHIIRLAEGDAVLLRGVRRIGGFFAGGRWRFCLIPFFGGLRKADILFTGDDGLRYRLVFKPSEEMAKALEAVIAARDKNKNA